VQVRLELATVNIRIQLRLDFDYRHAVKSGGLQIRPSTIWLAHLGLPDGIYGHGYPCLFFDPCREGGLRRSVLQ
jgi:hypothetical protein